MVTLLASSVASANTPEDVYGASSKTIAMGGAGTALPGDYSSVHYNPAGLAYCPSDELSFDVSYISHHLSFTDQDIARTEPLVPKHLHNQTRVNTGMCFALPFDLHLGLMFGFGTPGAIRLDQQTANEQPHFTMYGEAHDQVAFATGLSWKATPTLAVGAGVAVLIKSALPLTADFPILEPDPADPSGYRPVGFQLGISMGAMISPRVGVLWTPSKRFRIGAAYRGALFHDLDVDANITAKLIIEIPVPVHIDSLGWFSPRQFSAGASGEPVNNLTLTADVTYYRWGELRQNDSSYPFLNMFTLDPMGASGALVFPRPIRSGWKNNLAWRGGGELRATEKLAVRAGFGYRTRAVNNPDESNVNLLDGPVVTTSAGVSWHTGSTQGARGHWWRYSVPNMTFTADAFVRVDHMLEQQVDHTAMPGDVAPEKHFSFGGDVLQVGARATLGW